MCCSTADEKALSTGNPGSTYNLKTGPIMIRDSYKAHKSTKAAQGTVTKEENNKRGRDQKITQLRRTTCF